MRRVCVCVYVRACASGDVQPRPPSSKRSGPNRRRSLELSACVRPVALGASEPQQSRSVSGVLHRIVNRRRRREHQTRPAIRQLESVAASGTGTMTTRSAPGRLAGTLCDSRTADEHAARDPEIPGPAPTRLPWAGVGGMWESSFPGVTLRRCCCLRGSDAVDQWLSARSRFALVGLDQRMPWAVAHSMHSKGLDTSPPGRPLSAWPMRYHLFDAVLMLF